MSELEDAQWARLYAEVPSAFWLDPALWGTPAPRPAPPPKPKASIPPAVPSLHMFWQGFRVMRWQDDPSRLGYVLFLEGRQRVFVPLTRLDEIEQRWI